MKATLALVCLPCLLSASDPPANWTKHGYDDAETRFSPLNKITKGNVARLGLAWSFDMDTQRGLEATPLAVDGTIYATGSWSVLYAIDVRSGELKWKYDPKIDRKYGERACCDVVNRGAAYSDGRVFVGVLDGRLVALDAKTGRIIWQTQTTDLSKPYTITGAPRVVKNKVIIGNGGAEFGVRGYVSAYDAATGNLVWRFFTVPGDPSKPFESPELEKAAKTWTGEWWINGGGGTVWDSMAYDSELDLLYVGVGNGSPWIQSVRSPAGGDNLYLSSILAMRPDTGRLVWHYQTTPGDSWDYTATQHMILADLAWQGAKRKVLLQAPKNGFFYVLDRTSGELLSAKPFAKISWATHVDMKTGRPVEVAGARPLPGKPSVLIWPGPLGGHNWQPMSWNPVTGLVYFTRHDMPFPYSADAEPKRRPLTMFTALRGSPGTRDPMPDTTGELVAWDPAAGEARWTVPMKSMYNGGTLSTAGGLVFHGDGQGVFAAYDAADGKALWKIQTGTGIIAAPATYAVDGEQYVSILSGWGGAFGLFGGSSRPPASGRLLTFKLGGQAPVPLAPPQRGLPPPSTLPVDKARAERGMALYAVYCWRCHGEGAVSGGSVSDLRYSTDAVLKRYTQIVLDGFYQPAGMPSFSEVLTEEDTIAIRHFILERREALRATGPR